MIPERILKNFIIAGVLATPLLVFVVTHSTFFPFVFGKNIVFRMLVEVLFLAWAALVFINPTAYLPRPRKILTALLVFVGIVFLANIFGAHPEKSFWSNFERMEGFVTIAHLLLYTIVAAAVFTYERVVLWFWRVSLIAATLVGTHAFFQFILTGKSRLDSTLGNPIYLAVYALFHIFIALVLFFRRDAGKWERVFYAVVLPLQFWVLFMTATRGATLGVIGGLALATLGILFSLRDRKQVRLLAGGTLVALVILVGGFFAIKDTQFAQQNQVLKRFASISFTEGTVFARTVLWGMAWEGVKERPVLGWGQENFNLVFNKYYDPRMYAQEPWFDRVHNVVFDWLIAAGFLGLLAYISIFLALLWVLYTTHYFTIIQKWLLFGLLAAYGFHNLTVFDQVISYLLFFSVIAWLVAVEKRERQAKWGERVPRYGWAALVMVVLATPLILLSLHKVPIQTNQMLLSGLRDAHLSDLEGKRGNADVAHALGHAALAKLTFAANSGAYGRQEVHESLAQTAERFASAEWINSDLQSAWYRAGSVGLQQEMNSVSGDARFPVFLASLHNAYGNLEAQENALLEAQRISPNKQSILVELAANAAKQNRGDESRAYLEQAYNLEPSYRTTGILYAIRLLRDGNYELLDNLLDKHTYLGADPRLLALLVEQEEHERAGRAWTYAFTETKNPKIAFLLASIYSQNGDSVRAAENIRQAITIDPQASFEGEQILKTLE